MSIVPKATLRVNKISMEMNPFVEEFLSRTVIGMVTPLRGAENIQRLEIHQDKSNVKITVNGNEITLTEFPKDIIKQICEVVDGPISAEAISLDTEGMLKEGRELAEIHKNIVVKIPMTIDGLKAVRVLEDEGIKTNVTLIFSPLQTLMAAKAGASYVSPFVGRLDDLAHEGMQLVEQIVEIYSNYAYDTEIIVASIRNPLHVLDSALIGADIATIPFNVLSKLAAHHMTDKGIKSFLNDWKNKK